jgi:hypothetical protein
MGISGRPMRIRGAVIRRSNQPSRVETKLVEFSPVAAPRE